MNFKDLSKLEVNDLKNIDLEQLKDYFKENPSLFINIILIVITILSVLFIVTSNKGNFKERAIKLISIEKKVTAVDENKNLKTILKTYTDNLAKPIETDLLITKISNLALKQNIEIKSITPTNEKGDLLTDLETINLVITTNNYLNLIKFVKEIEELPYLIRTAELQCSLETQNRRNNSNRADESNNILSKVKITSLKFKDV